MSESADARAIVRGAYDRTAAAGPATARYEFETGWKPGMFKDADRTLPRWIRVIGWPVKVWARRATRDVDFSHVRLDGVVDLAQPRSEMAGDAVPRQVIACGPDGYYDLDASGSPSARPGTRHPLWLLALLKGVVEATPREPIRGSGEALPTFDVKADLFLASSATPGGLPPCETARVENLRELRLTVALDAQGRVRRVAGSPEFGETGKHSYFVELFDFGLPTSRP